MIEFEQCDLYYRIIWMRSPPSPVRQVQQVSYKRTQLVARLDIFIMCFLSRSPISNINTIIPWIIHSIPLTPFHDMSDWHCYVLRSSPEFTPTEMPFADYVRSSQLFSRTGGAERQTELCTTKGELYVPHICMLTINPAGGERPSRGARQTP